MGGLTPLADLPYPGLLDPPDGPAQFLAALAALEKGLLLVYTDAAARNADLPAPTRPYLAYLTATNQLTMYRSGAWAVIDAPWTSYTPTLAGTGWAVGNGTLAGRARITTDRVDFSIRFLLGSSSTAGAASPTLTLPTGTHADWPERLLRSSVACSLFDANGSTYPGRAGFTGASTITPIAANAAGTYTVDANVTGTAPFSWAVNDELAIAGWYRPA